MMPDLVVHPALDAATASLSPAFYARPVVEVARALIGMQLLVNGVGGRVVEKGKKLLACPTHADGKGHARNR